MMFSLAATASTSKQWHGLYCIMLQTVLQLVLSPSAVRLPTHYAPDADMPASWLLDAVMHMLHAMSLLWD